MITTRDFRNIDVGTLKAYPGSLPTLRMCTAPPLAVDRLVGLAGVNKSLVGKMEKGKLAVRMTPALLHEHLTNICHCLTC